MCGIVGSLGPQSIPIEQYVSYLSHRGPDGDGTWFSADQLCVLGHTRLSIQDVTSAGAQPITSHCGKITLVFNGEIYNHLQIRNHLRFKQWRGHSDSETLVEFLAEHGPSSINQLTGMFAFAAYDSFTQSLLLVRDRIGIKPLYLTRVEGCYIFASERSVLPNSYTYPDELSELLSWGHCLANSTFANLEGRCLAFPAGCYTIIDSQCSLTSSRYWPPLDNFHFVPLDIPTSSLAQHHLRELLEEVVSEHLLSDVPLASFLSSGIDSGIITALASRIQPGLVTSITVSLPGYTLDESSAAKAMAAHCGTEHIEISLSDDSTLQLIHDALSSLDVPSVDALNTYIVSRAAGQHGFKVALSGLGADELFGGYPAHKIVPLLRLMRFLPCQLRTVIIQLISPKLVPKLTHIPCWNDWFLTIALRRWYGDRDLESAGLNVVSFSEPPHFFLPQSWSRISFSEISNYTEPMLLRDTDNMSMASGLEIRVPFLDHRIVEFALRVPQSFHGTRKYMLRKAFKDIFPSGFLERPKQGFALPMDQWIMGPLRELVVQRLDSVKQSGFIDSGWIDSQWSAFLSRQLHWTRIWSIVVAGEFILRQTEPHGYSEPAS